MVGEARTPVPECPEPQVNGEPEGEGKPDLPGHCTQRGSPRHLVGMCWDCAETSGRLPLIQATSPLVRHTAPVTSACTCSFIIPGPLAPEPGQI